MNRQLSAGPYQLTIFAPDEPVEGVIYIPLHGNAAEIAGRISRLRAALVFIDGFDWNRDLSPWPAGAVFGDEDFSGQADAFLNELIHEILPAAEKEMKLCPAWRSIAGYSLAGLFAAYAVYRSSMFSRIASVSGSMWYDGWMEYAEKTPFASPIERAYFSVGAKEKKTRNARMQPVEENTRAMNRLFEERGAKSRFVLNPGNHFVDAQKRLKDALEYLMEE